MFARVCTECGEGVGHRKRVNLCQDAFCLFHHDSRIEGEVELCRYEVGLPEGVFVHNADGGNIRQSLSQLGVSFAQRTERRSEEVHGTDDLAVESERRGMGSQEALFQRDSAKTRPIVGVCLDIGDAHYRTGVISLNTRTGAGGNSHDLNDLDFFAG